MRAVANVWYYRKMSLFGKILIVNSLFALFVYRMQVLLEISDHFVNKVNVEIENFIWNNKRPKIARDILCNSKYDGGMGLVNIRAKQTALLLNWVKHYYLFEDIGNLANVTLTTEIPQNLLWITNLSKKDCSRIFKTPNFWHNIYNRWSEYSYHDPQFQTLDFYNNLCVRARELGFSSRLNTIEEGSEISG